MVVVWSSDDPLTTIFFKQGTERAPTLMHSDLAMNYIRDGRAGYEGRLPLVFLGLGCRKGIVDLRFWGQQSAPRSKAESS